MDLFRLAFAQASADGLKALFPSLNVPDKIPIWLVLALLESIINVLRRPKGTNISLLTLDT